MNRLPSILTALALALPVVAAGCQKKAATPAPAAPINITDDQAKKATEKKKVVDTNELEDLSLKILNAYKAKDVRTLAEYGPPNAKETLIFLEPRNPNYNKLLGDDTWRMKSLANWDGKIRGIRVGIDVAKIYYNDHPTDPDKVTVLELIYQDGKWIFHDLVEEDGKAYRAAAKRQAARNARAAEGKTATPDDKGD